MILFPSIIWSEHDYDRTTYDETCLTLNAFSILEEYIPKFNQDNIGNLFQAGKY